MRTFAMKMNFVEPAPPNIPSTLDRNDSLPSERVAMWLLGVALLAICLVASTVVLAWPV
jgi:hypothetical protein